VDGRKFVPLTVMVVADVAPAVTLAGLREPIAGTGLLIAIAEADDVPPPGVGLTAVKEILPGAAKSAAVRLMFT
jgi:hypothetical protein